MGQGWCVTMPRPRPPVSPQWDPTSSESLRFHAPRRRVTGPPLRPRFRALSPQIPSLWPRKVVRDWRHPLARPLLSAAPPFAAIGMPAAARVHRRGSPGPALPDDYGPVPAAAPAGTLLRTPAATSPPSSPARTSIGIRCTASDSSLLASWRPTVHLHRGASGAPWITIPPPLPAGQSSALDHDPAAEWITAWPPLKY